MKKILFVLPALLVLAGCQHGGDMHSHDKAEHHSDKAMADKSHDDMAKKDMPADDRYQAYSSEAMMAVKGQKPFVVFFYADWCPTCVKWEKRTMENIDMLPKDALIFKANYDTETDLASQFGVNKQSMAVFFDASGDAVATKADPSVDMLKNHFMMKTEKSADTAGTATYKEGTATNVADLKGEQKFVAFFHADWCPTCVKWDAMVNENLAKMPVSTMILKLTYDNEEALRQELGVNKQSTAVFFDAEGNVTQSVKDPAIDILAAHFAM